MIEWLNEKGYGAFEELEQLDIRVARDERYPNLFNLKYGSILADKANPIVCACRGAVVERVDDDGDHSPYYRLVAYAFDRFFNYGEAQAAEIDWGTAKVWEKKDGSLIKLFPYKGEWIVSTSGSVAGASQVGPTGRTFSELFWHVFNDVGYKKSSLNPNLCYIFELCHKDNRIVVDYKKPELPLLAVRGREQNFEELDLEIVGKEHGFKIAESYNFGKNDLIQEVNKRGADHEGFVISDSQGNRLKVKSDIYCQLHRVKGNGTPDFSELYLNDDLDEFLLHFPEFAPKFLSYVERIKFMGEQAERFVIENVALSQREFAQRVMAALPEVSGAIFSIRSGKYKDFIHFVENMTPKQLDRLLEL